jgi:DNA-binding GntR family transcriptional regulator
LQCIAGKDPDQRCLTVFAMAVNWSDFHVRRSATPAYVQLADFIGERIAAKDLQPFDQIPGQRELATTLVVAPETVAKAMAVLRERGLVETSQLGTFVKG